MSELNNKEAIDYFLRIKKLNLKHFSKKERLIFFKKIIQSFKGFLKYTPGFKTLTETFTGNSVYFAKFPKNFDNFVFHGKTQPLIHILGWSRYYNSDDYTIFILCLERNGKISVLEITREYENSTTPLGVCLEEFEEKHIALFFEHEPTCRLCLDRLINFLFENAEQRFQNAMKQYVAAKELKNLVEKTIKF